MPGTPTADVQPDVARDRRGLLGRRLAMTAIAVIVVLGATGMFGVRSTTVRSASGGFELAVTYPGQTRAGLPAKVKIRVVRRGPFTEPVQVALTGSYLDLFDEQGVRPEPTSSTAMDSFLVWEFDPPLRGRTLTITIDVIMETGRHFGRDGTVAIVDQDGQVIVEVELSTNVAP